LLAYIQRCGIPKQVIHDNAQEFIHGEFAQICAEKGIAQHRSPPCYNPNKNPIDLSFTTLTLFTDNSGRPEFKRTRPRWPAGNNPTNQMSAKGKKATATKASQDPSPVASRRTPALPDRRWRTNPAVPPLFLPTEKIRLPSPNRSPGTCPQEEKGQRTCPVCRHLCPRPESWQPHRASHVALHGNYYLHNALSPVYIRPRSNHKLGTRISTKRQLTKPDGFTWTMHPISGDPWTPT
jgi:hypothetical protein